MANSIDFYYDVSSPWTYLAFVNIRPLAAEAGATIRWKPFLVGGVFNAINPTMYRMRENPVPPRDAWMHKDMQAWARLAGVTIVFPPKVFPVNPVKALRGLLWAQGQGREVELATAFFELYWGEDRDISQDDVVAEAARRAGLDPARLAQAITEPDVKAQLKANTDELIARGGFGSPTMFVGDDMFFGNDRLPLVREALRRRGGS
jgi:2-hydroxychromene-2-carboxylate isomerase